MTIDPYMRELVAEIVANGNPDGDLKTELAAAHKRRQTFIAEMVAGETMRAKLARTALCGVQRVGAKLNAIGEQA
jgi:hypothetical protein